MKLKEFNFNSLKNPFRPVGLLVIKDNEKYGGGFIGETLRELPIELADMEIEETRWFFDTFVIELRERKETE